jgi:glucokinase
LVEAERIPADRQIILSGLEQMIHSALASCGLSPCEVMGIGVGLRGSVDPAAGVVYSWTETPELTSTWKDFAVRDTLAKRWSYPHIIVDDIVRTLGIAEVQYGHNQGRQDDFVYALADSGVGVAVMMKGAPYVGPLQMAGEIGHIPLGNVEIHCSCGNVGCLETVASATAILDRIGERLSATSVRSSLRENDTKLSIERVIEAAETGDKVAYQALIEAGEYFGVGLAIVVNLLGTELVVVGGSLAKSEVYLDAARRSVRLQVLGKASTVVRVEPSQMDDLAGARGAATQVLNKLFQPDDLNILELRRKSKT